MNIDKLKTELVKLLDDLGSFLDERKFEQVKYFIEYNELKLAVEFLCEYVYEDEITVDAELKYRINQFCKELNIDKIYWLDDKN